MRGENRPAAGIPRLWLHFASASAFHAEYLRHIARGGAFVPCEAELALRDPVCVLLDLSFCGQRIELDAEVVHVVTPELARAGGTAGVAVQFTMAAREVRELLAPVAEEAGGEEPEKVEARYFAEIDLGDEQVVLPESPPAPAPTPAAPAARRPQVSAEAFDPSARELVPDEPPHADSGRIARSRRAITRIQARIETPLGMLQGRTRNISHTGVLVSVDGSDLPVETPVRLRLTDPLTGERLQIDGRVARHVQGEGTVAALGIHFELPESRRAEVARFVDQLTSADRARRLGGIHGDLGEVAIANLLEMFSKSTPRGTLTIFRGGEEGVVAFESGQLRYARLGVLSGVKALSRILSWIDGTFEFHAHVDPLDSEDPPSSLTGSIMMALQQLDERVRQQPDLDPSTRLGVRAAEAEAARAQLGNTELAVLDLASTGFTVRRVLDVIPEPDAEILEAIASLRRRGILTADR